LKAQGFPPFAAAQPESQTRPQEISLFVEGFGKKDTPTAARKRIPLFYCERLSDFLTLSLFFPAQL
jgi:hypothetical protein